MRRIYASGVPPWPFSKITDLAQLGRELEEVRKRGYAASDGETEGNIIGLGAPVVAQGGFPLGAITLAIPGVRFAEMDEGELAAALLNVTAAASHALDSGLEPLDIGKTP